MVVVAAAAAAAVVVFLLLLGKSQQTVRCRNHCSKGRLAWRTGLMVLCAVIGDVTGVGYWCYWCYW